MISLSIVIPTLNEEKYLPRLLDSIKSQDFFDYEIIVSDGKSKDKTIEIAKNNGCKIIVSDKKSPAHQRNEGAKIAQGNIILFLDADNVLPIGFLTKAVKEFINKKLDVAGFYLNFKSPKPIYYLFTTFYNIGCFASQLFFPISVGVGIIVKKDKHVHIKGFDETIFIGEDYDYTKRISKIGKYRMIASTYLNFSVRRLEKEGVFKVLGKWIRGAVYFLFRGPIRKEIVQYEFGNFNN